MLSSSVTIAPSHDGTAEALRDRWRARTLDDVWLRPGDWYHPAVDALAEAVLAGEGGLGAAARLGSVRAAAGVGVAETLDDVAVLFALVGREPSLATVRALCEGWAGAMESVPLRSSCVDPESGLPTLEYLSVRLAETYGATVRGGVPAAFCLVLVDVGAGTVPPWQRMARAAAMGRALHAALPGGAPVATLGDGTFAVLAERSAELGTTVRRLREEVVEHAMLLQVADLVRRPPRIWVEALPATHDEAVQVLRQLRR